MGLEMIIAIIILVVILIWIKLDKKKIEKIYDEIKENYAERQAQIINGDINSDRIDFFPSKQEFLQKQNFKTILSVIIGSSILFIISCPLGFVEFVGNNDNSFLTILWGIIGIISLVCTTLGGMYWSLKYKEANKILFTNLHYDNTRNILFLEEQDNTEGILDSKFAYGQSFVMKIIYAIKNISQLKVEKAYIVLYGEIIMTSFDNDVKDMSYIENIRIDQKNIFFDGEKNITMYSKKYNEIRICRGYAGFEKFLISKKYPGGEKLLDE